ncbi:uncharacterized protein [Procambarus clarkii]|uniref:uncharacterized protein isoform X2 n=1 Tax=Procambarus clarkii TaxID=6728 RepID=UPI003743143A
MWRRAAFVSRCSWLGLRTGCLTIAALYLMVSMIGIILASKSIAAEGGVSGRAEQDLGHPENWTVLAVSVAFVFFNALLIVGVVKSSYVAVMFWVLALLVSIEVNLVLVVRDLVQPGFPLHHALLRLTAALLQALTIAVVHSYSLTLPT